MYQVKLKYILSLWLLVMSGTTAFSMNHRRAFGDDWREAETYVKEHRGEWRQTFDDFEVDAAMAEAIVFPELIRYNRWQDEIESAAVTALYVSGGRQQSNFSIGRFQMKPSFAEDVEKDWNRSPLAQTYDFVFDTHDTSTARRYRVKRLGTIQGQCRYLAIFIRLQQLRHPELKKCSKKEQVHYLATLYNRSYAASWQELERLSHEKHFHTDVIKTRRTHLYRYPDIAVEYYRGVASF